MKLSEYRKKSNEYTAKASEICRQLSLAGIAIIWLFGDLKKTPILEPFLLFPLLALALSLLFDLLQYFIAGWIWIIFFRKEEKRAAKGTDPEIKDHNDNALPIYIMYVAKMIFLFVAYIFIIVYLINKL